MATNPDDVSEDEDKMFPASPETENPQDYRHELKRYLEGAHRIGKGKSPLDWWSVSTAFPFITVIFFTLYLYQCDLGKQE